VKQISLQNEYTKSSRTVQLILPIATEIFIPEDDSVRLLSQQLEELDYSKLYQAYSHMGRNPAVSPKNLFKILVYGYMSDIITSRALERACRRDINFMFLLEGQNAPDHNTISRFRSGRLKEALEDLFRQVVTNLHLLGEVPFENLFVDGTKIEACANKYSFVWKKATQKNEARLQMKIQRLLESWNEPVTSGKTEMLAQTDSLLASLEERRISEGITFVHGTGKRKSQLQRDIELLNTCLEQQRKYDQYNQLFDGRNSFSKTDTDATFMHMKEDHMRNAQLKPGYNVQIGVEAEYVVGVEISSERSDQKTLIPLLEKMAAQHPKRHRNIIADAGYESEPNYFYLENQGLHSFIKPQNYERKKSKGKKNIGYAENMKYDPLTDTYCCNQGKCLWPVAKKKRKSTGGYLADLTVYECESCTGCPVRDACFKSAGNKKMALSRNFLDFRENSHANITTAEGILLRMNRSIQVEGVFGSIKEDHGFRRFLLRGRKNVLVEFLLMSLGHNMNKLHNKIQDGRCGNHLHEVKTA
jgi:transposase